MELRSPARAVAAGLALATGVAALPAVADGTLPLDPSRFPDPSKLLSDAVVSSSVRTVGALGDHRPYDPASLSPDGAGFELGAEVSLVHVPAAFKTALSDAGLTSASNLPDAVPVPRIHLRKRFGKATSIGLSGIKYRNYQIFGGDVKFVMAQPEEGPGWALRLAYSTATLGFVSTTTITPQFVVSRALDFFEPYVGGGWQLCSGKVDISSATPAGLSPKSRTGSASQGIGFLGIAYKPKDMLIQFALEGAFNTGGAPTLGVRTGINL